MPYTACLTVRLTKNDRRFAPNSTDKSSGAAVFAVASDGFRQREQDGECGVARLGADADVAVVFLDDDAVADVEAESGAFADGFGREERLEDAGADFGRDAGAGVVDIDGEALAGVVEVRGDGEGAAAVHRGDGVVDEV